jgi:hypothetical protein
MILTIETVLRNLERYNDKLSLVPKFYAVRKMPNLKILPQF